MAASTGSLLAPLKEIFDEVLTKSSEPAPAVTATSVSRHTQRSAISRSDPRKRAGSGQTGTIGVAGGRARSDGSPFDSLKEQMEDEVVKSGDATAATIRFSSSAPFRMFGGLDRRMRAIDAK